MSDNPHDEIRPTVKAYNAMMVILLTDHIQKYLLENDQTALTQLYEAARSLAQWHREKGVTHLEETDERINKLLAEYPQMIEEARQKLIRAYSPATSQGRARAIRVLSGPMSRISVGQRDLINRYSIEELQRWGERCTDGVTRDAIYDEIKRRRKAGVTSSYTTGEES